MTNISLADVQDAKVSRTLKHAELNKKIFLHIARIARKRVEIDTQKIRTELLEELKKMFKIAKEMATAEGAEEKQVQNWIRIMGYIGQVMNSLAKSLDEAKAMQYLENLERMVHESEKDPERSKEA
jgi:hypothetical protein